MSEHYNTDFVEKYFSSEQLKAHLNKERRNSSFNSCFDIFARSIKECKRSSQRAIIINLQPGEIDLENEIRSL